MTREERIENYYDNCSVWEMAEWLVDAEDDNQRWQVQVDRLNEINTRLTRENARLKAQDEKCCGNYRD